jgi:hypothetical protein
VFTLASFSVPAHHSSVMFEMDKESETAGTVYAFEWTNPHVWLWITVMDQAGTPVKYAFEGTSIGEMQRRSGWTSTTVTGGDKVTVRYLPFKDASKKGGRIITVTLPDGRVLDANRR